MRHILRFILFAILLGLATSANAQECSTADQPPKTWNQQPPDPLCGNGPAGNHPFTVVSTTVDTCTNNNTGVVYAQGIRQVTGNGMMNCAPYPLSNVKCNPTITQQVTHATSGADFNRFYLRAWDADPSQSCGVFVAMSRQDFWQCIGVACTCAPGCKPTRSGCDCSPPSPIILDLNGKGFNLTSAVGGVMFDISGSGTPEQMGWIAKGADNAFLALPGGDGLVHNGQQLFGNFTPQPTSDHPNGFAALAVYDDPKNGGNGDGVIDSRDAVFSSLRLWIDENHDGICQPNELHTLPSLGVDSISLKYKEADRTDQYGNQFRYRALVNPDDPDASRVDRKAYDVFFVTLNPTTKNVPSLSPAGGQKCAVPVPSKRGMLSSGSK